jgi:1-acyl-sn-glycerol-3-phosphate acyltransferase
MNLTVLPLMLVWTVLGILFFPALFPVWKITTRWSRERIMRQMIWLYGRGWLAIMAPFVRFNREGFNQEEIKPPCILVVNHLSFFDIFCLALMPYNNVSMTVRAWPFKMLWYAPFMHLAGYLNVESMPWQKITQTAVEILSKKGGILFFPEGHRSRNGRLQRFYSGAFKLAVETGTKIVPLCIAGTDELLPAGRWWLKPARVTLRALKPVKPAAFTGPSAHRAIQKVVKHMLAQNLMEINSLSGQASGVACQVGRSDFNKLSDSRPPRGSIQGMGNVDI